jgi:IMP dehydrogenase
VQFAQTVLDSGVDLFVIQGTVVSAEHVSSRSEPLNLKRFIADLDVPVLVGGCATYMSALHLMRTGAAGILVGVGPGRPTPPAACSGSACRWRPPSRRRRRAARLPRRVRRPLRARHRRRRHAHRRRRRQGDRLRRDAVMMGSPLARTVDAPARLALGPRQLPPRAPARHPVKVEPVGTLEEVLLGPARTDEGTTNLFGSLRRAMAMTGYSSIKEFQKVEVMVAPSVTTEGKSLQRAQSRG